MRDLFLPRVSGVVDDVITVVIGQDERGVAGGDIPLGYLGGSEVAAWADLTRVSVKLCFVLHFIAKRAIIPSDIQYKFPKGRYYYEHDKI